MVQNLIPASLKDVFNTIFGCVKPVLDTVEPLMDCARPVLGPVVDFSKNICQAIESMFK